VVAAHDWQAARSSGDYTLVGCTVAPGFVFDDFTMLSDVPALADSVRTQHPDAARFI
jgi:predicted cupin superfamily sugar epimerase